MPQNPKIQSYNVVSAMQFHRDKVAEKISGMTMLHAENMEKELENYIFKKL